MVCMTHEQYGSFRSPLARLLLRLALGSEQRRRRAGRHEPIPEYLRKDLGLDGGIWLEQPRPRGRSFDHFG